MSTPAVNSVVVRDAAFAPSAGQDRLLSVGWKVALDYRKAPTIRHTVLKEGEPVVEVRYVVLAGIGGYKP
jgi:hypothetical protein